MISTVTYTGDGATRVFPVAFEIQGENYVVVFIDDVAVNDRTTYDIINNSIVFVEESAPTISSVIEIVVASSPTEIADLNAPPSTVQTIIDNLADINSVATTVVPNIAEILLADDNATIATTQAGIATAQAGISTTKASEALTSAGNALTSEQNADISEANALSYKNSAETSATTATTKAGEASTSATNALASEVSASASATAAQGYATSINPSILVHNIGDESIDGVKTFLKFPLTPSSAPTANYEVANKKYVDDNKTTVVDATSSVKGIDYKGLLAEYTVSGSAVTSIDFSGLDINAHKSYRVEIELTNATAGAITLYCFVNGDTTLTNYWSQIAGGSNALYSGVRNNNPTCIDLVASSKGFASLAISKPNGYTSLTGTYVKSDSSSILVYSVGMNKTATVTNITQLTFTGSVASAIGVGSKIRIYRGDV